MFIYIDLIIYFCLGCRWTKRSTRTRRNHWRTSKFVAGVSINASQNTSNLSFLHKGLCQYILSFELDELIMLTRLVLFFRGSLDLQDFRDVMERKDFL